MKKVESLSLRRARMASNTQDPELTDETYDRASRMADDVEDASKGTTNILTKVAETVASVAQGAYVKGARGDGCGCGPIKFRW